MENKMLKTRTILILIGGSAAFFGWQSNNSKGIIVGFIIALVGIIWGILEVVIRKKRHEKDISRNR